MSAAISYTITELPDPAFAQYQLIADGDVQGSIWQGWESLARIIASFPPDEISVTLRYVFSPSPADCHVQSRLGLFLTASSENPDLIESFGRLIEQGPLSRFYRFSKHDEPAAAGVDLDCTCRIIRKVVNLPPLHGPEFNDRIPESYYQIQLMEPMEDNDLLALDRVLDRIKEPVVVELTLQPTDVSLELSAHTAYLAHLQSINRSWEQDDFDYDYPSENLREDGQDFSFRNETQRLKPFRFNDPLADDVLRNQQRFHENLIKPHFLFNLEIRSTTQATARLIASVFAESAFDDGSYRISDGPKEEKNLSEEADNHAGFKRLPHLVTTDEISGAFRLPLASYGSPLCIRKNTDPPRQEAEEKVVIGNDQELAGADWSSIGKAGVEIALALIAFVKHLFISGMSGFGKTTLGVRLLLQLYFYNVPFIIFEPVKTEFRLIKTLQKSKDPEARALARRLLIYTPGNDSISPMRHNFLQSCLGIGLFEHTGSVMECLQGAMPSLPMLPAILNEAIIRVYEGRDMITNPPTIAEFLAEAKKVLREKGYSHETSSDILAALAVRLGALTRGSVGLIFQNRFSNPTTAELIQNPTLIELDYLSKGHSSLLTLLLLMSIRENLITTPWSGGKPRLAIVIEEAHNLVGRTGPAKVSEEAADPEAFAAEAICKLLVEFRALGVSVIILDQHPSRVAPEVVKATTTHIAFRQTYESDREEIGRAMLFGPLELEEIARLKTGEAYYYTEALHGPRRIKTEDIHSKMDLDKPVLREEIIPFIDSDDWFIEGARDRAITELIQLKEAMDAYDDKRLYSIARLQKLLEINARIQSGDGDDVGVLLAQAARLEAEMETDHQSFLREHYRRYMTDANQAGIDDEAVSSFRDSLKTRLVEVIQPGFEQSMKAVRDLVASCRR